MDKLTMCRMCLVENVRMYVVVDKNMHELYEKLTDIPFVTEDSRPMLSCFICYAKLKHCCQLQRTCLAAEELLAKTINEPNPSITRGPLEYCNGLIKTQIQSISIVDVSQIESITIKEELPAVHDRQDGVMELKQENPQDDVKLEYENYGYSDEKDIPLQDSESDGDNVPLIEFKTEEGQEVSRKRRASDTRNVPAAKKLKPDPQKDNSNHSLSPQHKNKGQEHLKTYENTTETTSKSIRKTKYSISSKTVVQSKPKFRYNANCNDDNIVVTKSQENTAPLQKNNIHKDEFNCKICNYKGINSSDIQRHSSSHSNVSVKDKLLKCDFSQSSFSVKGNLKQHIHTHTGEKPNKCDICQSSFSRLCHLKRHIRTHTGEKPHKCDICHSSFIDKGNLKRHIRTHTGEKPYKCLICQSSFSNKGNLKRHIRTHTGEKPYKCDICQRSFNQNFDLKTHIRTHTGEKPYKCDICQISFNKNFDLKTHIRTHTREKPYKCKICQSSFNRNFSLKKHIRTHTGEKPYKCEICQSNFSVKSTLETHIRTHTREKPYKCDICLSSFSRKGYLKTHICTHTKEKPYRCDKCPKRFSIRCAFRCHVLEHH